MNDVKQIADDETPDAKQIVKDAGNRALANLAEIATSKTTWLTLAGIALDAATSGGSLTIKSLGLVALRMATQGLSDAGKTAAKIKAGGSTSDPGAAR